MLEKYEIMNSGRKTADRKKRVAVYCRVSTDREEQASSFESQQEYFRRYIEKNPDWELAEIFADEGITGTDTRRRKAFNRMIESAWQGRFDMIITKEISRFARNTLDSIFYTRELRKHGVGVIFLNDGINTMDGDSELRLAIMSSIAQEESRRTSERVKWGQRRQMEKGVVFGRSMLGYDVKDGRMYINKEGAETVRLIFRKFVDEGKGTHVIARELCEEGVKPVRVKEWSATVILRVLRNEKYCGDLVQGKTYTPDFLTHKKICNTGQEKFVIIKNHHEPIVSRETFERADKILAERSQSQTGKPKYSGRYIFSGKIKCGKCGRNFTARSRKRSDGSEYRVWRCYGAVKGGECGCGSIRNEDILYIMYSLWSGLKYDRSKVRDEIISTLRAVTGGENREAEKAVGEILGGVMREDVFYREILDRIIIYDGKNADICLKNLPFKFRYGAFP